MNFIHRTEDVITNKFAEFEHLQTIKNYPINSGVVPEKNNFTLDEKIDIIWQISLETGVIQLKNLVPIDKLYFQPHCGMTGKVWNLHNEIFANFIYKYFPQSIFEIGGGRGTLATYFQKKCNKIPWYIIEPQPIDHINDLSIVFFKNYFNSEFIPDFKFDMIVHSHVFEHFYYPNNFLQDIYKYLPEGNLMIFSIPNMDYHLQNFNNVLNLEHTFFLNEQFVEYLLAKANFRIIEKFYFLKHSIFYAVVKDSKMIFPKFNLNLYSMNKKLFLQYEDYYKKTIKIINYNIEFITHNLYIYGANDMTQYLISQGLDITHVRNILEFDESMSGKRLYGTNLVVEPCSVLKNINNPVVLVKTGFYDELVKNSLLKINSGIVFV